VAPGREEIAEEHGLELDRVLVAVRHLGAEAVLPGPPRETLDEVHVDRRRAEWRLVRLPREREGMPHARVTGPEDHEQVRVAALGEVAVAPRVRGSAAMKVDVRRDERTDGLRRRPDAIDRPRAVRRR